MPTVIQYRRGAAAEWTYANPILAEGELGLETDTRRTKIGNGVDAWVDLDYTADGGGIWGEIVGDIAVQADLVAALTAAKARANHTGTQLAATISDLGTAALLASDTDTALAANSDSRLPTQKAVKAYVDALLAAQDVLTFEGGIDCSANPNYPAASAGAFYKITVAGKIGGGSGPNVQAGDSMYCVTDGSAGGTHASVGADWVIVQVNIDGAVVGPASVTDGHMALFDGATGKLIKSGGAPPSATSPGGSDKQLQMNNAGAFGGIARWTYDTVFLGVQTLRLGDGAGGTHWAFGDNGNIYSNGAGIIIGPGDANPRWNWASLSALGFMMSSGCFLTWGSSSNDPSTRDTGLRRNAAGVMQVDNGAGSPALRDMTLRSLISVGGVITPSQYTNATEPSWVNGNVFFNTDLDKLRIGGASAWETVTSA